MVPMVFTEDRQFFLVNGNQFEVQHGYGPSDGPMVKMRFYSLRQMREFCWENLPERGGIVKLGRERVCFLLVPPDREGFRCYSASDLRRCATEYLWRFDYPQSDDACNDEFRHFRTRQIEMVSRRIRAYQEKACIMRISWNKIRRSWQASEIVDGYRIVYVFEDRFRSRDACMAGNFLCLIRRERVVDNPPTNGRRGFRLNILKPPILRVLDDREEIWAVFNHQRRRYK